MISQIALPEDTVGAFVPHGREGRAGAGEGKLAGRRFAVKDLFDVEGMSTGGGSPAWLATHDPATQTAPAVAALLAAGADLVGKTVCDEFFYSLTGANAHYGTPGNMAALGRLPGGSSSGSAAAVAAGLCDFSLGSDTGGSVRVPAAFCGLFGLRPTLHRVDLSGCMAMAPCFDTGGWFAREAELFRDIGHLLLVGASEAAGIERLLVAEDAFGKADKPVGVVLKDFLTRAADALPEAEPFNLAVDGFTHRAEIFRVVQAFEVWENYGPWMADNEPQLGPGIAERMAFAQSVSSQAYMAALEECLAMRETLVEMVPPGTIVALPTAPCVAPLVGSSDNDLLAFRSHAMALTCTAGISGLPQLTLPVGQVDYCPVGLSFLGWSGGDEALLDLAVALAPLIK